MQLTSYQIRSLTGLMTEQTEVFFEQMKLKIEQPLDLNELKNQFSWLEILDKLKLTFTTLIEVIGKGANILLTLLLMFIKFGRNDARLVKYRRQNSNVTGYL